MENTVKKWGVVPFRELDNENLEFLIVSTKNGNWGLPKGNLMNKLGPKKTALQEAYEEAGILGKIVDQKISTKVNGKRMAFYPMKVKNEISAWPESGWRKRRWIRQDEMSEYLNSNSLRSLLEKVSGNILQTCS